MLFLHGFPEIWYSWRHHMLAVAAAGYRAVALAWVRALGPATGAGGGVVQRPGGGSPRHPDALSIPKVALPFWDHCLHCIVWFVVGENFLW